ncbi:MAG: hypothetical protein K9M19_08725, partial [Candidatus Marinimicrobia bacterium]|nr:hypothetical protein [Candidatus Neomarinimicrobiota bacterium]
FMPNANPPHAQIQSPVADEVVSNTVTVNYSITAGGAPVDLAKLYYTRNDSTGWFYIDEIDPGNGIYEWSTAVLPDGYNYQIGIQVFAGESWNFSVSPHFILNNPGPANPEILPFYPLFERELDSTVVLSWRAGDPDGDSVNTIIEYSTDNGNSWLNLTTNTASIFDWDTRQFPNSENYKLRWGVTQDDAVYYSGASVRFSVSNDFTSLPDSTIEHAEGNSTGQIIVSVIPEQSITGHPYEVTFTGQSNLTRYNVSDMVTHQPVIQNELLPLYPEQGSLFDGLRLSFVNPEPSLNQESSGWNEGNTTLTTDLRRFNNTTILPYDYELVFFDTPIDTPWNVSYGVNVKVWNTTLAKYEEMFLSDHHPRDGFIGPLDNLVPTARIRQGMFFPSVGRSVSMRPPPVIQSCPHWGTPLPSSRTNHSYLQIPFTSTLNNL